MPPGFSDFFEDTRIATRAMLDYGEGLFNPTIRLGVTGLSRAGKTVFLTSLIANRLAAHRRCGLARRPVARQLVGDHVDPGVLPPCQCAGRGLAPVGRPLDTHGPQRSCLDVGVNLLSSGCGQGARALRRHARPDGRLKQ